MNIQNKRKLPKRTWISILMLLIIIPGILWLCFRIGNRHYYLAGLAIIICTMIPFFLVFEHRKPQARELVVLAVMSALAAASRAAFIWLPNFKPICAIIMITGIAFGSEAGFLTGAVSAFVSNFLFGQGPWTPWQMFAYGMAGFLAGLLFRLGVIRRGRIRLAIFAFISIVLIIGPILDMCAIFTMPNQIGIEGWGAIFASGFPVNLVHGSAAALTMFLFSDSLLDQLDRIRLKYGMLEDQNAI